MTEENALRSQIKESRKHARQTFLLEYLQDGRKMDARGDVRFLTTVTAWNSGRGALL